MAIETRDEDNNRCVLLPCWVTDVVVLSKLAAWQLEQRTVATNYQIIT